MHHISRIHLNSTSSWFERNPRKTLIGTVIVSMIILNFMLTYFYKHISGINKRNKIVKSYRIPSDVYHHDLAPNVSVDTGYWGPIAYPVRTNSLGFRDFSVREIPLVTDKHRILFIGDSFTEAVGVDYNDSFVGLISKELAKKDIEVLNAGVVGYSPIIYWRKTKYLIEDRGLKFDELVVFIDISDPLNEVASYYLNEDGNVSEKANTTIQWTKKFIKNNTLLYFLYKRIENAISRRGSQVFDLKMSLWTVNEKIYDAYEKEGLTRMRLYMDRLDNLLKRNNIKLTVAVYPYPDQIMYGDLESIHVQIWKEWSRKHDATFLNYFPSFITSNSETESRSIIDRYFIRGNYHWNEEGHKVIAEGFLNQYGVFTPPSSDLTP